MFSAVIRHKEACCQGAGTGYDAGPVVEMGAGEELQSNTLLWLSAGQPKRLPDNFRSLSLKLERSTCG
jgi:hypothetical protein